MQQLLQITSTPIEYKIEIEAARLDYNQAENPRVELKQQPAKLNTHSKNIQVRIDTMDMRRSLGFQNNMDRAMSGAQKGESAVKTFIANQNQMGRIVGDTSNNQTISDVVRQKVMEQPDSYTVFLPSVGPQISWVPNQLNTEYQRGELNTDWQTARNIFEYVPGKYHMNITQYPKVEIKYLGDPLYVPPSADPNYEAAE